MKSFVSALRSNKTFTLPTFWTMYYAYVLESTKDHDWYVGYTHDLQERFTEHSKGLVESTRDRRPLKLVYYESYLNRKDAMKREIFLKSGWGKNYLKRVLANYLKER